MPLSTAGSLGPAFATARPVGLAVRPAIYPCALLTIANRDECTFELLRYNLGGNRPSQTDPLTRSPARIHGFGVRQPTIQGWYFTDDSLDPDEPRSKSPIYATHIKSITNIRLQ
jgi:hypothetical protein